MPVRRRSIALALTTVVAVGCVSSDELADVDEQASPQLEAAPSSALDEAGAYVGLEEQAALDLATANGVPARVGTVDDVGEPGQTEDYEVGRLTFVLDGGIVAEVVVETDTGPETVAAG